MMVDLKSANDVLHLSQFDMAAYSQSNFPLSMLARRLKVVVQAGPIPPAISLSISLSIYLSIYLSLSLSLSPLFLSFSLSFSLSLSLSLSLFLFPVFFLSIFTQGAKLDQCVKRKKEKKEQSSISTNREDVLKKSI